MFVTSLCHLMNHSIVFILIVCLVSVMDSFGIFACSRTEKKTHSLVNQRDEIFIVIVISSRYQTDGHLAAIFTFLFRKFIHKPERMNAMRTIITVNTNEK